MGLKKIWAGTKIGGASLLALLCLAATIRSTQFSLTNFSEEKIKELKQEARPEVYKNCLKQHFSDVIDNSEAQNIEAILKDFESREVDLEVVQTCVDEKTDEIVKRQEKQGKTMSWFFAVACLTIGAGSIKKMRQSRKEYIALGENSGGQDLKHS